MRRHPGVAVAAAVLLMHLSWGTGAAVTVPSSGDVGEVGTPGRVDLTASGRILAVAGAGADIWGSSDAFHFAWVEVVGDFDVRVRVDDLTYTHAWAKAGVMVRDGLGPDAPHALMSLTPAGVAEFIRRGMAGGDSSGTVEEGVGLGSWVRLQRSGSTVTGLVSRDGRTWSVVDETSMVLPERVSVGVAVTSRDVARTAIAILDDFEITAHAPLVGDEGGQWVCGAAPLLPRYEPTMFVAPDGSDSNDGRSAASPLRTLQRAADAAGPGEVIWLRSGIYSADVSISAVSGTRDRPIVIEAHPGECAVFDGRGLARHQRLQLWDVQHLVLRNVVVRNSPAEGILVSRSRDVVIANVRTHDNQLSGILLIDTDHTTLTRIVSHGNFDAPHGQDADGISISSGDGNVVDRCVVFGNSDDGVDTWRSTNSLVQRCVSFDNGWQGGDGKGFKAGGDGRLVNTIVRHSIAFGNRTDGFDYNSGRNVTFEHNTSFGNGRYGFVAGETTALRNNLAVSDGAGPWSGSERSERTTNSWSLGVGQDVFIATDRSASAFLSLASGSAATGRGSPVAGSLVASRRAPDLGALPSGETIASFVGVRLDAAGQAPRRRDEGPIPHF